MPFFACKARDPSGKLVTERLEVASSKEAADILERRGLLPVSIQVEVAASAPGRKRMFEKSPPVQEFALVTRQLATLVRAGIVVHTALDTVATQCKHKTLKKALLEVTQDVTRGTTLAKAMERHPAVFNDAYVRSIEAGQMGGRLDSVLTRLAGFMETATKRKRGVKAALRYPIIVMVVFTLAFFFLVKFVVPNFVSLFARFEGDLPMPTKVLLASHKAITEYAWITALGLGAAAFAVWIFLQIPDGRKIWDRLKLEIPVMGSLQTKSAVSIFLQTFNTLNESGVPILSNLDVSAKSIGNAYLEQELRKAKEGVEKGESLSRQLMGISIFPPLVYQMIAVGEKSGRMAEMLDSLVQHYDQEVQQAIEGLTAAIEPIMTVLMGGMVLFLALGIFLPMWKLLTLVQRQHG